MNQSSPLASKLITMALACAALAVTPLPVQARDLKAHGGTTFTLLPVEFDANQNPTKFAHTVDGVVRVSLLGNCTFHADVIGRPRPDGTLALVGTLRITSADGGTTLDAEVVGATSPDASGNPFFGNVHYEVKFTGGTGEMAKARGQGVIDGFAMFTSQDFSVGKATWLLHGEVQTRRRGHDN